MNTLIYIELFLTSKKSCLDEYITYCAMHTFLVSRPLADQYSWAGGARAVNFETECTNIFSRMY